MGWTSDGRWRRTGDRGLRIISGRDGAPRTSGEPRPKSSRMTCSSLHLMSPKEMQRSGRRNLDNRVQQPTETSIVALSSVIGSASVALITQVPGLDSVLTTKLMIFRCSSYDSVQVKSSLHLLPLCFHIHVTLAVTTTSRVSGFA